MIFLKYLQFTCVSIKCLHKVYLCTMHKLERCFILNHKGAVFSLKCKECFWKVEWKLVNFIFEWVNYDQGGLWSLYFYLGVDVTLKLWSDHISNQVPRAGIANQQQGFIFIYSFFQLLTFFWYKFILIYVKSFIYPQVIDMVKYQQSNIQYCV